VQGLLLALHQWYYLYCQRTPKWEKELKSRNIDWKAKFNNIAKICHENRLQEFNFKVLHRLTVTKKELSIYGINDENSCLYCKEPDSILHTFVECHCTQTFYDKVVDWFNAKFNCQHLMKCYSEQILILQG